MKKSERDEMDRQAFLMSLMARRILDDVPGQTAMNIEDEDLWAKWEAAMNAVQAFGSAAYRARKTFEKRNGLDTAEQTE